MDSKICLTNTRSPERAEAANSILSYRRNRGAMIELFKHMPGEKDRYDPVAVSPRIQLSSRPARGIDANPLRIISRIPRGGLFGFQSRSFYFRSIPLWNNLPAHVVLANTLDTFKKRLDDFWTRSGYDQYNPLADPPCQAYQFCEEED